ncbi:MAG: DUF3275 family protein [Burkholderiales bacterium]|jgi:hypothetical protein|nr:DUF3275 family protein [Burkholderiales bacterium]
MIQLNGHLAIRTISGRNGDFNVGRLTTSIGEFVIKDAMLDQNKEGKYQGNFVITEISPSYYTYGGRLVVEIRAKLDSMQLDDVDDLTFEEAERIESKERDPIEEERQQRPSRKATSEIPDDEKPFGMETEEAEATTEEADEDPDKVLFGILWPLSESVRLDVTVDRQTLRAQTKRLEQLGYELDFKTQSWNTLRSF